MAISQAIDIRRMALPMAMHHMKATSLMRGDRSRTSVPTTGEKTELFCEGGRRLLAPLGKLVYL